MISEEVTASDLIEKSQSGLTSSEVNQIVHHIILENTWKNYFYSPQQLKKNAIEIHPNLYQDLEIFSSYTQKDQDTIYHHLNHTQTTLGDFYLKELLRNPTRNPQILSHRQKIIQNLIQDSDKFQKVGRLLAKIKELENQGLWIWKEMTPEFHELLKQIYFQNQYLTRFNQSETILKYISYFQIIFLPLYGLLGPIIFFVVPYLIVRFFYGIQIPIKFYFNLFKSVFFGGGLSSFFGSGKQPQFIIWGQYLIKLVSFGFYLYGIYNSFQAAYTINKITNLVHSKVNQLARLVKTSHALYQEVQTIMSLENLQIPLSELWDPLFEQEPYLTSNKGRILKTFDLVQKKKELLNPLLQIVGLVDAHYSIAQLYLKGAYNYPIYLNHPKPLLMVQELWNPFLDPQKAVKNNLQLGDGLKTELFKPNNMIVTGPNASGKSTFIKSLILSVLMAQSLGLSPSKNLQITPFQFINTYLNIPDVKGRESLFEAEMNRSRQHIEDVTKLKKDQYSLVVMDEIFNSTNYEEGVAGAYIVAKELGQLSNSLAIVTTHFPYLTKLSQTGNFLNYKFEVEKEGLILKPTYCLKEGISKQHLALDMLEKKGYQPSVIKEARKIFQELVEMTQPNTENKTKTSEKISTNPAEMIKIEIKTNLENKNLKKSVKPSQITPELEKKLNNLNLVCMMDKETKKEEILEKIQKAVEEKVSKDLGSD